MSFQITLAPNRRAAARFVGSVRRRLQRALAENPDVSRSAIARDLGVHRSVITRQLQGTADMTLGRVAEIAWSLGYRPKFELERAETEDGANVAIEDIFKIAAQPAPITVKVSSMSANASVEITAREPA